MLLFGGSDELFAWNFDCGKTKHLKRLEIQKDKRIRKIREYTINQSKAKTQNEVY